VIELSDKDLKAVADSRAWEGKRFKWTLNIMSGILLAMLAAFIGYAAYLNLNNWPAEFPDLLLVIGIACILAYFLFIFIGGYVRSKQILKQLKKERDSK